MSCYFQKGSERQFDEVQQIIGSRESASFSLFVICFSYPWMRSKKRKETAHSREFRLSNIGWHQFLRRAADRGQEGRQARINVLNAKYEGEVKWSEEVAITYWEWCLSLRNWKTYSKKRRSISWSSWMGRTWNFKYLKFIQWSLTWPLEDCHTLSLQFPLFFITILLLS